LSLHRVEPLSGSSILQRRYLRLAVGDDADGVLGSELPARLVLRSGDSEGRGERSRAAVYPQVRGPLRGLGIRRDRRGSAQTKPQEAAERE
jgi:hypothetical protein